MKSRKSRALVSCFNIKASLGRVDPSRKLQIEKYCISWKKVENNDLIMYNNLNSKLVKLVNSYGSIL